MSDKNSGALFKNETRQKDTEPYYKGSITIEGVEYYLSAWVNKSKTSDKTYMALKATPKAPAAAQSPVTTPTVTDPVDDLPF